MATIARSRLDKAKFVNLFIGLCEMFDRKPSEFLISMYYDLLRNYSNVQVDTAIRKCLQSLKYFPKPAEIIEVIPQEKTFKALPMAESEREKVAKLIHETAKKLKENSGGGE